MLGMAAVESKDMKVVQASEIISKIENSEPIDYSYVKVKGDLNLSGLDMPTTKHITSQIKINDSIISDSIDLHNIILDEIVTFRRTKFMGLASFAETQFNKDAYFDNSEFNNDTLFINSRFNGLAYFAYTKFNRPVNFLGAKLRGETDFHISRFNETANFRSAMFEDESNFEATTFTARTSFWKAQFNNANFKGTRFKDFVDFDYAQFNKSADFFGANFGKELYFNQVKFAKLSITWDSIKGKLVCDGPSYLSLIKNFKDMEQYEDADNSYYQYRDLKRKDSRPLDWSKFFDYISWLSCGYGVRWQHTILSATAVALLFGLYYESYYLIRITNFLYNKELKNSCKYDFIQNFKKSMSFSVMLLLSLPPEWSKFGRDEFAKFVTRHWFSSILERLIGWGLVLLLIGTLTRLMVRY